MLSSNLNENLKIMNYCPVCKVKYNPLEARIIDEKDGAHLMHVKCKKCRSSVLVLVFVNNVGINSIGLITDLDSDEILNFSTEEIIDSNQILSTYQILKEDKNIFKILKNTYGKTAINSKNEGGEGEKS